MLKHFEDEMETAINRTVFEILGTVRTEKGGGN